MIYQGFRGYVDTIDAINRSVNTYIEHKEVEGYIVVDKSVLMEGQGDNSLCKPHVLISIWMEKSK